MHKFVRVVAALAAVALVFSVPTRAYAQASTQGAIAGVVRDASGAVLPGVTVEAASPVLIEKVRTAITDGEGQYKIVDLPAGTYTVTFTLTGFSTVKREGIQLTGSFTATVNADLKVGQVAETITVTGAAPIVDVQSSVRQQTVSNDTISNIPVPRIYSAIMNLVPGTTMTGTQDVGGQAGPAVITFTVHGGRTNEGRIEVAGMNAGAALNGAGTSYYVEDIQNAQEVQFTSSGGLGEAEVGGPVMNVIPKTGGNQIHGTLYGNGAGSGMVGSNYTSDLKAKGLKAPNQLQNIWDVNGAVGGPIAKDKIWFFFGERYQGNNKLVNMFVNQNCSLTTCNSNLFTYSPDLSQQATDDGVWHSTNLRLTWQATPRNKLQLFADWQTLCISCGLTAGNATTSPEAFGRSDARPQWVQTASWTSPVTNRLLLEAGFLSYRAQWGGEEKSPNATISNPRISEICAPSCANNGGIGPVTYHSVNWANDYSTSNRWQASATYVTGSHNAKIGYQGAFLTNQVQNQTNLTGLSYSVNNGVPFSLTQFNWPYNNIGHVWQENVYAQDQWTFKRLTLSGGLRFDYASSNSPDQTVGPTRFFPNGYTFAATSGVTGYKDITPRVAAVYDLFGNGKSAVRVTAGKYLEAAQNGVAYSAPNPTNLFSSSTTRSWTDGNHNFTPDCDLLNPNLQDNRASGGDLCGAMADRRFGTTQLAATVDPAILSGWGVRPGDWDYGVSFQQQLFPRTSAEIGYFRRNFMNYLVTDNQAVDAAGAFTPFSVTAPSDSRLPGGGGYSVGTLYNVTPALFGQVNNVITYASQISGADSNYYHSDSIDLTINVRNYAGLTFQGGVSSIDSHIDYCGLRNQFPGSTIAVFTTTTIPTAVNPWCSAASGWLTDYRGLVSYMIPKAAVQVAATFQSNPGAGAVPTFGGLPGLAANTTFTSAQVAGSLGRPLAGNAANVTVNVLQPGTLYGDRINQLDLRFAKIFTFGANRLNVGVDIYNALNSNPITAYNQTFGTSWLAPQAILPPRFAKVSAQFDF